MFFGSSLPPFPDVKLLSAPVTWHFPLLSPRHRWRLGCLGAAGAEASSWARPQGKLLQATHKATVTWSCMDERENWHPPPTPVHPLSPPASIHQPSTRGCRAPGVPTEPCPWELPCSPPGLVPNSHSHSPSPACPAAPGEAMCPESLQRREQLLGALPQLSRWRSGWALGLQS